MNRCIMFAALLSRVAALSSLCDVSYEQHTCTQRPVGTACGLLSAWVTSTVERCPRCGASVRASVRRLLSWFEPTTVSVSASPADGGQQRDKLDQHRARVMLRRLGRRLLDEEHAGV